MAVTLALAGDTMLGRGVAEVLGDRPPESLVAPEVVEAARNADAFVLNLECCISDGGTPWPDPGKPFYFRAPPAAVGILTHLGVSCVTLANNHALDFGAEALRETLDHLAAAGILCVGAGANVAAARAPAFLQVGDVRVAVIGATDHPEDFAAGPASPGVAYANLRGDGPGWLPEAIAAAATEAEAVLVTPHWGPNMVSRPVPHVRRAAPALLGAGATLVAGHSAHVFQGVEGRVLYDLGDFLDDYAVDPVLRNDLGLLWRVTFEGGAPTRLEALPLRLEYCFTRLAEGEEAAWILRRFRDACAALGTAVEEREGWLVIPVLDAQSGR